MFQTSNFIPSEEIVLNGINTKCQQITSYTQPCPLRPTPQWLNGLDQLISELRAYAPQAAILNSRGRPQAQQRLNAELADLQAARETYAKMVQSVIQTDWECWRIMRNANAYATAAMMDVANHSHAVSVRSTQGFLDVIGDRCYDCHCPINIVGGGYCQSCARRRGLIW